jgi:hypothetical protein
MIKKTQYCHSYTGGNPGFNFSEMFRNCRSFKLPGYACAGMVAISGRLKTQFHRNKKQFIYTNSTNVV